MASVTKGAAPRFMIFNVRPIRDGSSDERWHWTVYDDPHGRFVRDGQITGDQEKAERAARAAIAVMGGTVRSPKPADTLSDDDIPDALDHSQLEVGDP